MLQTPAVLHLSRNFNKMPCYRKDDRAMRPIAYMGALTLTLTPTLTLTLTLVR